MRFSWESVVVNHVLGWLAGCLRRCGCRGGNNDEMNTLYTPQLDADCGAELIVADEPGHWLVG